MIEQEIEKKYNIKIIKKNEISKKIIRLETNEGVFILKKHESDRQEKIFSRIKVIHNASFQLPKKSVDKKYIERINDSYYSLSEYLEDENNLMVDLRLKFYVNALASLHSSSSFPIRPNDSFLDQSITFLDKRINKMKSELIKIIEKIENDDYHSPYEWFFLDNYQRIFNSYNSAEQELNKLEDEWKKSSSLYLSITYQNFDINHIFIIKNTIISLDNMQVAPSIYDLEDMFTKIYMYDIDVKFLLEEYLSIHPLEEFEKHWLMSYLYSRPITLYINELDNFNAIYNEIKYLEMVETINKIILSKIDE